ncbi:MAG TPA: class I SAM-dependent methyltransferase [Terrimicrobiaceae bacterium]
MSGVRMNHPEGKRLLANIRGGDFAHAGEEAAVHIAWKSLPKRKDQHCLDAGCGRGGTAALVQRSGWGLVTGLDIDRETISFACETYADVRFIAADITRAGELFPGHFDVVYAFNAFYAFPDQAVALNSLRQATRPDALLCLFDYVDRGGFCETAFAKKSETRLWRPMKLESLPADLEAAGWRLKECLEIHSEYREWYADLVQRFARRRQDLLGLFAPDLVAYAEDYYQAMLRSIEEGALGGAIVYAQRSNTSA